MENKEQQLKEYLKEIYKESINNPMYAPDVFQSRKDFEAGYEKGQPKWISVKEELPNPWSKHSNIYESDEVLLDCGDTFLVRRYVRILDKNHEKVVFEGFEDLEEQDYVKRWMKIPA